MPQTFRVLQCYSCSTFQVHPLKKTNKWICKICNERQSVIKVFDQGSSVDCRKQVQKLNMMRKEKDDYQGSVGMMSPHPPEDYITGYCNESGEDSPVLNTVSRPATILSSKQGRWTIFAEPKESDSSDQDLVEENEKGDTFTTSREEFEQICRKVRKERSSVRSANSRLTGFHPVSKRKSNDGLKSSSTTSLPNTCNLSTTKDDDDSLFPYSSMGEHINDMLNDHAIKITSTKSLHNLDDVYGSYHKIEETSQEPVNIAAPPSKRSLELSSNDSTKSSTTTTTTKDVPTRPSKWSKFVTVTEPNDD